jgi:hypothetical protein
MADAGSITRSTECEIYKLTPIPDLFSLTLILLLKMWSSLLPVLAALVPSTLAAPAAVPNGGVGVRPNDTAPVYAPMSDCKSPHIDPDQKLTV